MCRVTTAVFATHEVEMSFTPGKIVRSVMISRNSGILMFNDKILGGRSIKVWGFELPDYQAASDALAKHGYRSKLVKTAYGVTRLHVATR